MFDVNWSTVINWLMHPELRTAFNINFLNALLTPFNALYNTFKSYRDDNIYKLNHNGQVCYLEGALNDAFDIDLRRMTITDAGGLDVTLLATDADADQFIILDDDATGAFILSNDSGYNDGEWDFIVTIPYLFSSSEKFRLRALVDFYKLAGKRYDVIVG